MDEVRIKKGSCVFGSERVMIEETLTGYVRNLLDMWYDGDSREKIIFCLSVFAVFFSLSFIANFLVRASFMQVVIFSTGLVSVLLLSLAHKYDHGFTSEKFIQKENIDSVKFVSGRRWITCPRFIVNYNQSGEEKKRYIMMPTHLIPGVEDDIDGMKKRFEEFDVEHDW